MSWARKGTVPGMVPPRVAQVVMANLAGANSLREIQMAICGDVSLGPVRRAVIQASSLGLVNHEPGVKGALRTPTARFVENWGTRQR